ncbi:hypothetical protein JQ557_25930 [Bradyrhizobium sp. U87765 SZCCT0131]|uniref:hypothetical protein n=1 Tax=unclassified Bradyrhizobium TaxID=2631580 RepID=UPI001BA9113C|nr:hypothetical protein [Bradyrhizobium sp. U87765 SZCCT0131]MBR1264611.1 hypothetical protein [Bradyrhizobium sp. U87765 SZCCT0134]MBR1304483.1 hypothetical protein [Bradyrhizobium sp. U87765 SZCCT0110]MBR1322660.1 hypothetical protein [Bradyrhizobium sp. U87765 SZCCT0109]MBR1346412.1 hypothetical protein [Bradyrhizobium sp. U87765 SZCCT0048]
MCTLYSITTNQEAIRRLFGVTKDSAGNLPPMPAVFPDWEAPVIRLGQRVGPELLDRPSARAMSFETRGL